LKYFIVDTNILLHDPSSLFSFPNGRIVLHFLVLKELDVFKKESTDRGYNARESIRVLDSLSKNGSLTNGVQLHNGGSLIIAMENDKSAHTQLTEEYADEAIIELAIKMKNNGMDIILISKDFNMRVRAGCFGIPVDDYRGENISKDSFYRGWREFLYTGDEINRAPEIILKTLQQHVSFVTNEFIYLKSSDNSCNRIFRYLGENNFKETFYDQRSLWGIETKNPQQEMVIDLLMDDSIQLVILCGPSGTGKTFLVLASMLQKILCSEIYQKMLISRPLIPLGPDIGYLPGDLHEKLHSWMQPIRDNLEFLIHKINQEEAFSENLLNQKNNFQKKRRRKKNNWQERPQNNQIVNKNLTVDDLVGSLGKISLEAITYMRGRSIPNQAIFIDEVQNLTPHEVKTLISRAGEGSKIILVGDPYQIDSPYLDFATNGLTVACNRFKGQSIFGTVYLHDSVRSILSCLANSLM